MIKPIFLQNKKKENIKLKPPFLQNFHISLQNKLNKSLPQLFLTFPNVYLSD